MCALGQPQALEETWRTPGDSAAAVAGETLVNPEGLPWQGAFLIFVFGDCELDLDRFELRRAGRRCPVEPQVFDLLAVLIRERHRVVPKEELLDTVWGNRFVSESALTSRVKAARQAIGDDGRSQRLIRTAHGRGYQFIAPVDEAAQADPAASVSPAPPMQEIRFCTAGDGTRLAYATSGAGPPLVKAANWLSHLAYDWESPVWRHWLAELSSRFHLIRYDERGCGLSDWDIGRFSFDDWVDDLEAVVDAAGLDRFPLLGISQGGPVAIAYAVRHPRTRQSPGAARLIRPRPAQARQHIRRTRTRRSPHRDRPPGLGPSRPDVPADLRIPLPARSHPRAVAQFRRASAALDIPGERMAIRRRHSPTSTSRAWRPSSPCQR